MTGDVSADRAGDGSRDHAGTEDGANVPSGTENGANVHSVTGDGAGVHSVTGDVARERTSDVSDLPDPRDGIFTVHRPWGNFQQFVSNERVTVKIITVDPGHRLSLQTHDHRGEFWQVLDVPIEVTVGDRTWTAAPGEAVWVPCHAEHRMTNKGDRPGRLLEIAFGEFDEADIVRLQDDYARDA